MTAPSATVAAHAKVNLVLRVMAREPNGYHRIETAFQRLALADDVTVAVVAGSRTLDAAWVEGSGDLGPVERNLAYRAAVAYADAAAWPAGWQITLRKRIPAGAGLGGGSSDAAAVLRALNRLSPKPLALGALCALGGTLGADVPFFVRDVSLAIGRGYGEELTALPPLPPARVMLLVPAYPIATAGAYAALDAHRGSAPLAHRAPLVARDFADWHSVAGKQANDFEEVVFAMHPDLGAARRAFEKGGADVARLSGSGSVVFGAWAGKEMPEVAERGGARVLTTATV